MLARCLLSSCVCPIALLTNLVVVVVVVVGVVVVVELADDTYTTVDEPRLFTTSRSTVKAKFHYTDPTGPARTQRSFAAKKVRAGPCGSGRVRSGPWRVRVVEFSYYNHVTLLRRLVADLLCKLFLQVNSALHPFGVA